MVDYAVKRNICRGAMLRRSVKDDHALNQVHTIHQKRGYPQMHNGVVIVLSPLRENALVRTSYHGGLQLSQRHLSQKRHHNHKSGY